MTRRGPNHQPVAERLQRRLVVIESGCIEWTASTDTAGYGQMSIDGKSVLTHRLAWTLSNGPIADGLCVLHMCDNRRCCNVEHLFLGTIAENNADRSTKGRSYAQSVTHCPQDHAYDEINTYVDSRGHRSCRTCGRVRSKPRMAKLRAQGIADAIRTEGDESS